MTPNSSGILKSIKEGRVGVRRILGPRPKQENFELLVARIIFVDWDVREFTGWESVTVQSDGGVLAVRKPQTDACYLAEYQRKVAVFRSGNALESWTIGINEPAGFSLADLLSAVRTSEQTNRKGEMKRAAFIWRQNRVPRSMSPMAQLVVDRRRHGSVWRNPTANEREWTRIFKPNTEIGGRDD